MIDNSDRPGDFSVLITAEKNQIYGFQCPSLEDVKIEVARLVGERTKRGLPSKVIVRPIISRGQYGEEITLS